MLPLYVSCVGNLLGPLGLQVSTPSASSETANCPACEEPHLYARAVTFIPRRFTAFVLRQFLPFLRPPTVCRQILPPHQLGEPGRLQMLAVERSRTREVALASAPKWYNSARSGGTKQTDGARKRGFRVSEQVLGPSGIKLHLIDPFRSR